MITPSFDLVENENYSLWHLNDPEENEELIKQFSVTDQNAIGLETYLKYSSFIDEETNMSRTYIVKDKTTDELVCYFTLRAGLITEQRDDGELFDSIPAIELSNFAMNASYKQNHPKISKLGTFILSTYIIPICRGISKFIGVHALYIYALPIEKLIEHYKTMGFRRLSPKSEKFVQAHVKPKYDAGCIFMYQTI